MKKIALVLVCVLACSFAIAQQQLSNAPSAQKATLTKISNDTGWPRTFKVGTDSFVVYQPQIDKWEGNRVYVYSAVEMRAGEKAAPKYGVVWFNARTEVDKINRLVTLDNADVTKVDFPASPELNPKIMGLLKQKLPSRTKTISLDRMEAAVKAAEPPIETVEVKNDPPRIILTTKPSILVTIDGKPRLTSVEKTDLQRIMNTSSTIFFEPDKKKYYLRVSDWWLTTEELDGAWERANKLSGDMKKVEEAMAADAKQAKEEMSPEQQAEQAKEAKQASLKDSKEAVVPGVYVVYSPAELIETKGDPQFTSIAETSIEYIENSLATILRVNGINYLLISGRWFKTANLTGEWTYAQKDEIPTEFAKIPIDSPMAKVLVSVPGTPQAQEALIANSIPQTATITRIQAKLTVLYDGEPTFVPVEGTSMTYARNTSVPVIKTEDNKYYAVESGVWFVGPTPQGPWRVADSVPDVIYTIPPSSPIYYVTYARVYGSTPEVVYVGYTPGYYGTVVSKDTTTVVYGTGYYYAPYVSSTAWYGYPYTYGVGAGFTWASTSGWSFSFGYSYGYYPYYPYYPWWGPMGYYGYGYYPYYGYGAWGGAAAFNAYGRWGNTAYARTGAAWANPYTGNYGGATRGAYHNTATGRTSVAGRGYNSNIYTGNTAGYRGGATYNPNTGIVAGGGAGFAGNRYTGEGVAGRGGFAYNTNTGAGIAAGKNNVYAGKDGTVYRYDRNNGSWSQNSGNGWQAAERPANQPSLQRQQEARTQGAQRSQNFNSMRSSGNYNRGSYSRPTPSRMGGGGRRR